jgi:hypothetical protein
LKLSDISLPSACLVIAMQLRKQINGLETKSKPFTLISLRLANNNELHMLNAIQLRFLG